MMTVLASCLAFMGAGRKRAGKGRTTTRKQNHQLTVTLSPDVDDLLPAESISRGFLQGFDARKRTRDMVERACKGSGVVRARDLGKYSLMVVVVQLEDEKKLLPHTTITMEI